MRRQAVASEGIASIGYDESRNELEIEFRQGGSVYRYFEVPPEEHFEFMAAESKGTYLNQVFKLREHPYLVVRDGRRT
ncbi:KTSC domain-containing protein [Terriglobus albidus]|uniref:KTSC domain-containing protein n=1 Tax=Terriglobus albidus TaxID=1592106 RepID=UPI0021E0EE40|nr:KTSC domain-containing protein [Terriglobus albidus]